MRIEEIGARAAAYGAAIAARKVHAMEYQADAKVRVAESYGLPRNYFFGVPYADWIRAWQDYCDENGFAYYSGQPSIFPNPPRESTHG